MIYSNLWLSAPPLHGLVICWMAQNGDIVLQQMAYYHFCKTHFYFPKQVCCLFFAVFLTNLLKLIWTHEIFLYMRTLQPEGFPEELSLADVSLIRVL